MIPPPLRRVDLFLMGYFYPYTNDEFAKGEYASYIWDLIFAYTRWREKTFSDETKQHIRRSIRILRTI